MNKLISIILSIFCCGYTLTAQTWECDQITSNVDKFEESKVWSNNKWATNLMSHFALNSDGEIELNYIIKCSDTIPRIDLVALTEGWLGTVFTNANNQILVSNQDMIKCVGDLGQVAFEQKFIGATRILAPIEIVVQYKENRVRLTLLTKNYRMAYANIGQLESGVIRITETYPFSESSKHKSAFAIAYINTIFKLLNISCDCIDYLNKHTMEIHQSKDGDNSDW